MNRILINNIIQKDNVSINFDLQDGSLSFPTIDLVTSGDIELNPLVIKLTELIELGKKVDVTYEDTLSLLETDSKIKLVKETLEDIYNSFNLNITEDNQQAQEEN